VDSTVDENWAKQHHVIWYEREVANGNIPKPPEAGKAHPAAAVGKVHPAE
jgi:cytochrome b subunit of formate dehydrogenase